MTADALISRLEGVKVTGSGRWLALCPAHDDRRPSLSIAEKDDGVILIHCWSGCSAHEVLTAIDLDFNVLFPEPLPGHKPERRPFATADVLRAIAFECLVCATAGVRVAHGAELTHEDRARLILASGRIQAAIQAGGYEQ